MKPTLAAFDKVLVANRGEIACRIFRTLRRLGIRSVAVYSEADRDARHVRLADEAHLVGGAPARESYLVSGRILEAAKTAGAPAIHPGYGFLSENADFAEACERAGLVFVGPPPAAIRAMGSKAAARARMQDAGVPLVPGYHGDRQDADALAEAAAAIGYPVMIKASAGGGGRGMRIVRNADDFAEALASCRRESRAAFGDDRVLLERYVERSRHVEVQVVGDREGRVVHLFERDCSIQRRHQKVIEEAPAPGLTEVQRTAMGRAAVQAARAVDYVGAGTVEFLLQPDGRFSFMEMNTRLQVEHPVTEMVTGVDLVEWQLRVAAGEPLPCTQEEIALRGHAIETRIYAEDPARGFVPSTGRLAYLAFPAESPDVRVDTGVDPGDPITPWYDPMIAKLVVRGGSRDDALRRLRRALSATRIVGVANNVELLARVAAHERFAAGTHDTGLIDAEWDHLLARSQTPSRECRLCAALAVVLRDRLDPFVPEGDPWSPWSHAGGFRLNAHLCRRIELGIGAETTGVLVEDRGDTFAMTWGGAQAAVRGTLHADHRLEAVIDGCRIPAWAVPDTGRLHVFLDGERAVFDVVDPLAHAGERTDTLDSLHSPMPGTVVSLLVTPGSRVRRGDPLLVLEAMKMEHTIRAPTDGVVKGFFPRVGDQVPEGAELVDFQPDDGDDGRDDAR